MSSKPKESMELSATNYYTNDENFPDYTGITTLPSVDDFEYEKINPSDIKKINKSEIVSDSLGDNNKPNATTQLDIPSDQKFSKLLFSSPSATVTSHGPSGPFKAIICHDCDNSEGRNVGHSVSFSAIKSWNVGSSNSPSQSESHAVDVNLNHTLTKSTYPESDDMSRSMAPLKYYENQSNQDENEQIEMNDKVELYKNNAPSETEKPPNTWNYSLQPINNENVKHINTHNNSNQKKPIFNDLLKVPYDVLNAPAAETPSPETAKNTQIHINHQQKFNDTITSNYQHFQQFIQKNLKPSVTPHYQSTAMPEQNYEVDESVSLMTNGRAHGVQSTTARIIPHIDETNANLPSNIPHDQDQDAKFGYVVEGRNFRKYRVEEKTADGFIVGEYGLLNNNDGSPIQGVRYTADSNINPRLIYDALLKFLSL